MAKALDIKHGAYERKSIKGGGADSGQVTLRSATLSVSASQGEGIVISACRAGSEVGPEHCARLHELDDIAALAARVRAIIAKEQQTAFNIRNASNDVLNFKVAYLEPDEAKSVSKALKESRLTSRSAI